MQDIRVNIHTLLRVVADIVKDGDDKKIVASIKELRRIRSESSKYKGISSSNKKFDETKRSLYNDEEIRRLVQFESRPDAEEYLRRIAVRRSDLEDIARALKLPLSKKETFEDLVGLIVDASVGYKLRSKAIRGIDEKGDLNP